MTDVYTTSSATCTPKATSSISSDSWGFCPSAIWCQVYYQHAHTDDFALREGGGASYSWLDFVTQEVPRLREAGWVVEIDTDFPLQVVTADAEIDAELVEGSGIDWLELNLGVTIDGQRVDLVPPLLKLIAKPEAALMADAPDNKPFILPLPDGRLLSLPMARIRPTLQALLELWSGGGIDSENGKIGFSRLRCRGTGGAGGTHRPDLARRRGVARPWPDAAGSGRDPEGGAARDVQRDAAAVSGAGRELAAVPRHRPGWAACWPMTWAWARPCRRWRIW